MAQVFQPRLILLLKLGALVALALFAVAVLVWRISIAPHPSIGSPVEQIVPFSHKHHVGDVGLDCRYCHTSVEKSAFAGMPSTSAQATIEASGTSLAFAAARMRARRLDERAPSTSADTLSRLPRSATKAGIVPEHVALESRL